MKKRLPKLKSNKQAEAFLERDLSDYLHSGNFSNVTFEFAPKDRTVSLRLPDELLTQIKAMAKKRRIPYQRYIRRSLEESLRREGRKS